jgi:branched-chain amino acid aminotransferase
MHSLYIRPTGISMENSLGVKAPSAVKLFVIMSPVGPYYPAGFKPVSIFCHTERVRAWHGGSGHMKLGANYGPTIYSALEIQQKGFDQILWLVNDVVSEVGVMNFFVFWTNEQGQKELITCPLDGTILPGVTRDSILQITKRWGEFKVTERQFKIDELVKAIKEKRVIEAFGAGTAAVVSPVKLIQYKGEDLIVPIKQEISSGELTNRIMNEITDI